MDRPHGPENAEHELRKAYNAVIESSVTHFWDRRKIPDVSAQEVVETYQRAYDAYRNGDGLAAERWARTTKHLARALWHEAKIAYLEPRETELPFLTGSSPDEYNLHEHSDTTGDLLDSLSFDVPPGMKQIPELMQRYLARGRAHLVKLQNGTYKHELLRAERIKAAHEYGRTVECLALAYEAEFKAEKSAA